MPSKRERRASPVARTDPLVAENGADERNDNRRRREHQRTVGDGRQRQPADEEVLIEKVADEAEHGEFEPVACESVASACERRCRAVRRGAVALPPETQDADDGQERRRGDRHPRRVERLGIELAGRRT